MIWIALCLGAAVCTATADALSKKSLETVAPLTAAWGRFTFAALTLLPLALFSKGPDKPAAFWTPTLLALPIEIIAAFCFQNALKAGALSLTIPYLGFTPVFLLGIGWFFLGEALTAPGIAGVLCVTAGAFFLQGRIPQKNFGRAQMLMLAVAFLYSFTALLSKKALLASTPYFMPGVYLSVISVGLLPFQFGPEKGIKQVWREPGIFFLMGASEAAGLMFLYVALLHINIAYAITLKRLSLLLAVFSGHLFFKEGHVLSRTMGAVLMLAGAALIAFH